MVLKNSCTDGVSNTRPERRLESALRVLVDWVQVTFKNEGTFEEIKWLLGLKNITMEYRDYGRDTFTEMFVFSGITIMRKQNTIYRLVLTGTGCREFESLSEINWLELFTRLKEQQGCDFRRLDIAIDDFEMRYDVNRIRTFVKKGLVVTRMQEYTDTTKGKISTGELTMDSLYLGSMESRLSINFYDKKLERLNRGNLEVTVETWTRTELRCKKEYSNQAIDMILLYEMELGKVAFGILKKNIRFIINNKAVNKREVRTAPWWKNFVGDVEKLTFSLVAPDKTIEKLKDWHFKSIAPGLAAIKESMPNMIEFYEYIQELVANGEQRLNDGHHMMIEQSKELRFKEVTNKKAKAGFKDNENERYLEKVLRDLWEETGKGRNREMKKTSTSDSEGIVTHNI